MRAILQTIAQRLKAGQSLVLATIIQATGATPREPGAAMLVDEGGYVCGTIGGGSAEYQALQVAQQVLAEQRSAHCVIAVNWQNVPALKAVPGGEIHVLFAYLDATNSDLPRLCETAEQHFAAGDDLWLSFDLETGLDWTLSTIEPPLQNCGVFVQKIATSSRVYLLGGGHVSQELVPVLSRVGFRCVVLEDREEFAQPDLFPTAETVRLVDFYRLDECVAIQPQDYVCIMTRGHGYDLIIQAHALRCRPRYLGVIGSRAKAAASRQALKAQFGFSDQDLDRITTPIGLSIDAKTPAEIAVSIAAQMIQVRAAQSA